MSNVPAPAPTPAWSHADSIGLTAWQRLMNPGVLPLGAWQAPPTPVGATTIHHRHAGFIESLSVHLGSGQAGVDRGDDPRVFRQAGPGAARWPRSASAGLRRAETAPQAVVVMAADDLQPVVAQRVAETPQAGELRLAPIVVRGEPVGTTAGAVSVIDPMGLVSTTADGMRAAEAAGVSSLLLMSGDISVLAADTPPASDAPLVPPSLQTLARAAGPGLPAAELGPGAADLASPAAAPWRMPLAMPVPSSSGEMSASTVASGLVAAGAGAAVQRSPSPPVPQVPVVVVEPMAAMLPGASSAGPAASGLPLAPSGGAAAAGAAMSRQGGATLLARAAEGVQAARVSIQGRPLDAMGGAAAPAASAASFASVARAAADASVASNASPTSAASTASTASSVPFPSIASTALAASSVSTASPASAFGPAPSNGGPGPLVLRSSGTRSAVSSPAPAPASAAEPARAFVPVLPGGTLLQAAAAGTAAPSIPGPAEQGGGAAAARPGEASAAPRLADTPTVMAVAARALLIASPALTLARWPMAAREPALDAVAAEAPSASARPPAMPVVPAAPIAQHSAAPAADAVLAEHGAASPASWVAPAAPAAFSAVQRGVAPEPAAMPAIALPLAPRVMSKAPSPLPWSSSSASTSLALSAGPRTVDLAALPGAPESTLAITTVPLVRASGAPGAAGPVARHASAVGPASAQAWPGGLPQPVARATMTRQPGPAGGPAAVGVEALAAQVQRQSESLVHVAAATAVGGQPSAAALVLARQPVGAAADGIDPPQASAPGLAAATELPLLRAVPSGASLASREVRMPLLRREAAPAASAAASFGGPMPAPAVDTTPPLSPAAIAALEPPPAPASTVTHHAAPGQHTVAPPAVDIDELVERTWRAVMTRLAIERERRGYGRWN